MLWVQFPQNNRGRLLPSLTIPTYHEYVHCMLVCHHSQNHRLLQYGCQHAENQISASDSHDKTLHLIQQLAYCRHGNRSDADNYHATWKSDLFPNHNQLPLPTGTNYLLSNYVT